MKSNEKTLIRRGPLSKFLFCQFSLAVVLYAGVSVDAQCKPIQIAKLLPDDGAAGDWFGGSVAISGTTVIIGAWWDDDNGEDSGSAYLFNIKTGQQIAKLLADDGAAGDRFGHFVAISGLTAIVGAYFDDDNGEYSGSAYLFDATTGKQIAKLLPVDGAAEDRFGWSVGISGTTAVVGAWSSDSNGDNSGSAYLFDVPSATQIAKLLPDNGAASQGFGWSVAIAGDVVIVGAPGDTDNGVDSGAAYVFDRQGQQIAKLLADDGAPVDLLGRAVSIYENIVVVGAQNNEDSGAAYIFDATTGKQTAKLLPNDGAAGDRFGFAVGLSETIAVVGAFRDDDNGENSGSAYLFNTKTGQQITKFTSDDNATQDEFGRYAAISGTTVICSAIGDDDNGEDSGSAYLFDINCPGEVVADSFLVTRGTYVSGGVTELADSDNMDLSLRRRTSDIQSRTEFEVKSTSPTATPSSFKFTLEGSVFARGNVVQTIELFDYVAGDWELVDSSDARRAPAPDSIVAATPTGDLSRFVEAGTMCIEARIHFQSDSPRQRFASNTDQAIWTIGQ